jgi:cyanophycinase
MVNRCSALLCGLVLALLLTAPAGAQGYICAEGGGSLARTGWSSPVFKWMVEKGKGGPVVILGAPADPTAANELPEPGSATAPATEPDRLTQRFLEAGAQTVADERPTRAMADEDRLDRLIREANIVFMRGGSQTEYVELWKGTRLEAAVRDLFARGGVVGGTSAGCAVLGKFVYDAKGGSCAAIDALTDARTSKISLTTDFLELVPGVLFDTHFTERARLPRLAVMLGHIRSDFKQDPLGIGVDTRTALCISPDLTAEVIGQGAVSILALTPGSRVDVLSQLPPTVTAVAHTQLLPGQRYDIKARRVLPPGPSGPLPDAAAQAAATAERDAAVAGRTFTAVTLSGDSLIDSEAGQWRATDLDDRDALWLGRVRLMPADARLKGALVQTRTFESPEFLENRLGGPLWALALRPGYFALWLTRGNLAKVTAGGTIRILAPDDPETPPASAVVLDGAQITNPAQAQERTARAALGPRQVVGFEGAFLHVLAPDWAYDARSRRAIAPGQPGNQPGAPPKP